MATHNSTTERKFNREQLDGAFSEIADNARVARSLSICAAGEPDMDERDDLIVAVRQILERIGFIADHHCRLPEKGAAENWMLPPAYHQAAEKEDES